MFKVNNKGTRTTSMTSQKLVPDPFLILVNDPKQPLHARNSQERALSKSLKKVSFIFSVKPSPF